MVFMFFGEGSTAETLGIFFIVLNVLFAIFAVCFDKGKFVYVDLLLRFHMILFLSLVGCLLFPIGTLAIGGMAFDNINFKCKSQQNMQ